MACRLSGAKPLSEAMMVYCHLVPLEHYSVKLNQHSEIFIQGNAFQMSSAERRLFCLDLNVLKLSGIYQNCVQRCSGICQCQKWSHYFSNSLILFIIKCNIFVWNWSNAINIRSTLWILIVWCFCTKPSIATVLSMLPYRRKWSNHHWFR